MTAALAKLTGRPLAMEKVSILLHTSRSKDTFHRVTGRVTSTVARLLMFTKQKCDV